jgi:hypothetical protein
LAGDRDVVVMGASRLLLLIEPIFRSRAAVGKRRTIVGMSISAC